jgi:ribonuclease R
VGALPIHRVQVKADRRSSRGTGRNVREIEIPKEVHITPRMYQKLARKIVGKPEERILSFLMLRSLKQARYSEENSGHFALAATAYTHFTSPIRRYPDLIVHRILKDVLRNSSDEQGTVRADHQHRTKTASPKKIAKATDAPSPWSKRRDHAVHSGPQEPLGGPLSLSELREIAEESSLSERRADEAERELMEWKKVRFMEDRVGEDFDALIISVTKFGFFVELTDLFVEGLVPLSTLTDDRYTFHENTKQIIGQQSRKTYSLGARVRVLVDRIDAVEKKIQFAVLDEAPVRKKKAQKRK